MDQSSSEDLEINCQRICSAAGDVICPEHFGRPRILLHTLVLYRVVHTSAQCLRYSGTESKPSVLTGTVGRWKSENLR